MKQALNAISSSWKDINYYQRLIYEYDFETYVHCQKVAHLSVLIARVMGIDNKEISSIHCGALIHDLGKIRLSKNILHKETVLNQVEWDMVKQHPRMGLSLFEPGHNAGDTTIRNIICYHHERVDGGGYPFGLTGSEIPLEARIVSIADAVDAMTTYRCYREGVKNLPHALAEVVNKSGDQFDEDIVNILKTNLMEEKR